MALSARRVLIADDHPSFRAGVRGSLCDAGIEVVGEASTGTEAVRLALDLEPDVVVLDVRMPELDGIAAASRLLTLRPRTPIVMLSLSRGKQHVLKALSAGVKGYVAKDDALECLPEAVRAVSESRQFLSASIVSELERTEGLSAGAERDMLALYDQEAGPLCRCAWIVADSEDHAREALRRSFLAYLMARNTAGRINDPRTWLLVSMAAILFERRRDSVGDQPQGKASRLLYWLWTGSRTHPNHGLFSRYWSGTLPDFIRTQVLMHVSRCASCHFEWCLVAFANQYRETRLETANPGEVVSLRKQLLHDLEITPVVPSLLALAERDARVRELVASDLQVLLGSAAVREWKQRSPSGPLRSPVAWTEDFLGHDAAPFVETLLQTPKAIS